MFEIVSSCIKKSLLLLSLSCLAVAQVSVLTQRYDSARDGLNASETTLTPSNVNTSTFGKLFSLPVDGRVFAQPLYVPNLSIPGNGTHNVVFIATEHDSVFAYDADGLQAQPLWMINLATSSCASGWTCTSVPASVTNTTDTLPEVGITSTPVIDPSTDTIYVVAKTQEVSGSTTNFVYRLHALDINTGTEQSNSPVVIQGQVPGSGSPNNNGSLLFSPLYSMQRPGLVLVNNVVYVAFGAWQDFNVWHGWLFGYDESSLAQTAAFSVTPNGSEGEGGIWMHGNGLAADTGGYLYFSTGNGGFDGLIDYSDSFLKLSTPSVTVADYFTPFNQAALDAKDLDISAGGLILLPDSAGTAEYPHILMGCGKNGAIYVIDRDNMGQFNSSSDSQIIQELLNVVGGTQVSDNGSTYVENCYSSPAYWQGYVYWGGVNDSLKMFNFTNGLMSASAASHSSEVYQYPGASPMVSANGSSQGIVWTIENNGSFTSQDHTGTTAILHAYDATNLATELYNSNQVPSDVAGAPVKFTMPVVANGKVYVGTQSTVAVYGLFSSTPAAATPTFSPLPGTYTTAQSVSLTDTTPGATIYYTTNGTTPTTSSTVYNPSSPIAVTASTTIEAMAAASGYNNSAVASGAYVLSLPAAATPTFSPLPGTYTTAQSVSLTDTTPGATIYYTTNGTTPTTSSTVYNPSSPIAVTASTTIEAMAAASGYNNSAVASGVYVISNGTPSVNYSTGFTSTGMALNGNAALSGTSLQLTNGGTYEASSAFYTTALNVQSFTTNFSIQLTNANADGMAFVIQNVGTTALGPDGGGLGYGPDLPGGTPGIGNSLAVKFDLFSNDGEGTNSTGLYTDGASPTIPATTLGGGVNLHSGDVLNVQMTYNGTTLTMTITDASVPADTFTTSWTVNIPSTVGANTAYVGFTAGTGGETATQDVLTWTFNSAPAAATPTFSPLPGTYTTAQSVSLTDTTPGATIHYTTNGTTPTTSSTVYNPSSPIAVTASTTIEAMAAASGYNNSAVASGAYVLSLPAAATPTFSPLPGTYTTAQSVSLTDTTPGATIYYTTNGTTPTTSSTVYNPSSPIAVTASTTIEAMAAASGYNNSAVASGVYVLPTGSSSLAFVQACNNNQVTGTTSLTINIGASGTCSASANPVAGHLIVAYFSNVESAISSSTPPRDTLGNTWTCLEDNTSRSAYCYSVLTTGGSADTLTVTSTFNSAGPIFSLEFSGVNATPLDGSAQFLQLASSTSWTLASDTTTNANDVVVGCAANTSENQSALFSAGAGYTIPADGEVSGGAQSGFCEYQIGTVIGTYSPTASSSSSTAMSVDTMTVAFKSGLQAPAAATPTFSPLPGTYTTAQSVSLTDTTPGATIYYTTNGTTPTTSSTVYNPSSPIAVTASTTIEAMAAASGYNNSAVASGAYVLSLPAAATPTFSPLPGTYTTAQSVSLTDTTPGATIHYTTNGTTPTTSSTVYNPSSPIAVTASTTIEAMAAASGYNNSAVASGVYVISNGTPSVNYSTGFTSTGMALNGNAALSGTSLQLTNGGTYEASSAFYTTALNVQSFTTNFSIQLTNANADGMAFVIQNVGTTALGPDGGGLGYGPDLPGGTPGIGNSLAVKFDLFSNDGEGTNSTGLYTDGASPTIPATTLGGGVNLHSGDVLNVQMTYNGTTLTMTITDASVPADTFTTSWTVNIPSTVGANTAYVGFTAGTGGETATQDVLTWTFNSGL